MKLRGVPVELRVGPVELRPFGKKCALLQPCSQCKLYPRVYFMCQASHVTCTECFLSHRSRSKATQQEGFCGRCHTSVPLFRIELSVQLLQTLKFICGCNYIGRLCDIKKHVKSPKYSARCCAPIAQPTRRNADVNSELTKLHTDFMRLTAECEEELEQIATLYKGKFVDALAEIDTPQVYTLKQAEHTKLELGFLNVRLNDLRADLLRLRELSVHVTPAVESRFEETFVCVPYRDIKRTHIEYLLVASGIPFRVFFTWDNQRFASLGMRVSATDAPHSKPWPVHQTIVVRLHDRKGFIIKELSFRTFTDQAYVHGTFKNPTLYPSAYQIPRFFDSTTYLDGTDRTTVDIFLTLQTWPLD